MSLEQRLVAFAETLGTEVRSILSIISQNLNNVALPSLSGNTSVATNGNLVLTISNYDSFTNYTVAVSRGAVSRTGNQITITAPSTTGTTELTVGIGSRSRTVSINVI